MTDWPDNLKVGSIREWPGKRTAPSLRRWPPFTRPKSGTSYGREAVPAYETSSLLDRELRELRAKDAVLLVAIDPSQFKLDGTPRAQAKADHPGVILEFDMVVDGQKRHASFACDLFTTWQGNYRAIALGLEALRKVKRYGIAEHGEQYRAYLAIEAGTAMPAGFHDVASVVDWLHAVLDDNGLDDEIHPRLLLRRVLRISHPDTGTAEGAATIWERAQLAQAHLQREGML